MATTLNVKLSDTLVDTLSQQGVYAYAVTFDGNGMVGNPTTIVDGKSTTPTVTQTVQVDLPSTLNGGKIYFIIQSVTAGNSSGLFGAGGAINQESDINWDNAEAFDFRYDSFEVSLLGMAGDAGNLTDVNVYGIPMGVTIDYPNGSPTQTRGYAVNGSEIFDDIASGLVHTYTAGPLAGTNRLAAAPATALAAGGPGGASADDWNAYVQSLGAGVADGTVTLRLAGYFNGAPSVDYMTYNGATVQYMEYHNPGFYAYTASWKPGDGNRGTFVLTPEANSQVQGIVSISSSNLANSIYATLGSATVSNGTTDYLFSSLSKTGTVEIDPRMNTGVNNQWGATFVKFLTGFIGGYLGGTNIPLNALLGSDPVNLSLNWNFDPTFAFHGPAVAAGQPGAVTPWTWESTTYGSGVAYDPYAEVFFDKTNSYGNGYSDALMSLFQQGGPLMSTGYSFGLGSNPFQSYAGTLGSNPLQSWFGTLTSNPFASYSSLNGSSTPFAATANSSIITVTDANATSYALAGSLVSFSGAVGFAGLSAANLNRTFTIAKVLSSTQYQVDIGVGATSSTSGGGAAVQTSSNVLTVTDANAANYAVGGGVTFAGAASFANFATTVLNAGYTIANIVDATHYQVITTTIANASTTGGGGATTAGANVITVTDPNAASYAALGGYVSLTGASAVGGIALPGTPLEIVNIVDATHYQVVIAGASATSSATGGGTSIALGSSALTVTDPDASNYAAVGALVSFGGVTAFAGIEQGALNAVFEITKVIGPTQYQVQLAQDTATTSAAGGGAAVVGATNVQSITIELFDDDEPAPPSGTLAEEQGYTPTVIYDTYDPEVGALVTPLTSTGAPNLSLIISMGVGTMRVDPDATVTLGFYTGTTGGLAQFTQVEIPTSSTETLYQTWNFDNTAPANPTFDAQGAASPAGNILQLNALPYDTGVNWYQLTISQGGTSRTYNMYMNAEKTVGGSPGGVYNPQFPGNDPGSIALDNLASLPAELGVQQYLTSVNVGLFNGGTVSLDPALMEQVTDATIIAANPGIWVAPDAPVLGTLAGKTFTSWGAYQVSTPNTALGDVTSGALAFGWMGSDQQWVGFNASQATPVNVIGGYTNKVGASNVAYVQFQGTAVPAAQAIVADIDGKWTSAKPANFVNGSYTATMTEYAATDTTYSTPLNLASDTLSFTVALDTLALQTAPGGKALQLDAGGSESHGNWIELKTGSSYLPRDVSIVVYATNALGALVSRDGSATGAGVSIADAVRSRLGWIVDDDGVPMLKGTNGVYLPVGLQLRFAVERDGVIDLASAVTLKPSVGGSFGIDVGGLRLSAEIDNTLDPSLVLAESQRATDRPLMWLRHGDLLRAEVMGDADFGRSTFGLVRIDVDPVTGAWSVGGVAYGATAAFADAVRNNLDTGFRYQGGGDFGQTRTWSVAGADGYFAPVLINRLGEVIVAGDANPGGAVQIRTFGANTFGIENRTEGNRPTWDFNDFVVRFTTAATARILRQTVAEFFDPNDRVLASADTVILQDTAAALQALTVGQLAGLDAAADVRIDATGNALALTLAQYRALGDTELTKGDTVTLADTGARLGRMLAGEIADLFDRGIDRIDATDNALRFDVAQARALGRGRGRGRVSLAAADTVTLSDSEANLLGLTPAELIELVRAGVDRLDARNGSLSLSLVQFRSLGSMLLDPTDALTLAGTTGNDRFEFEHQVLGATDRVAGGPGSDHLVLDGDYSAGLVVQASTLSGIERISFAAGHDYRITLADANVASGALLAVYGAALGAGDALAVDGSAETNGRFAFTGGAGSSTFTGGHGQDRFVGGSGLDTVRYTASAQSTSLGYDTVAGFNAALDRFDLWTGVTAVEAPIATGTLRKGAFDADLAAAMTGLGAHHARLFTPDSGGLAGSPYLVIDTNGMAGYQAGADLVVKLEGATNIGSLGAGTFV